MNDIEQLFLATGKEKKAVLQVADRLREKVHGDYVSFVINRNINFTNVCYMGCKFCGFAKRLPDANGYKVVVEEAMSDIYSKDINKSLLALNKTIEKTILMSIEQYSWEYKRFRQRPDGTRFY